MVRQLAIPSQAQATPVRGSWNLSSEEPVWYGARIDLNIGVREVQVATSQPLNLDDADLSSLLPRPSRPALGLLSTG